MFISSWITQNVEFKKELIDTVVAVIMTGHMVIWSTILFIIMYHHVSSCIIMHHYASSSWFIIIIHQHHSSSSFIIINHHSSSFIVHHHSSSFIIHLGWVWSDCVFRLMRYVGLRRRPALAGAEGMPTRQVRVLWNIRALGYATRIT